MRHVRLLVVGVTAAAMLAIAAGSASANRLSVPPNYRFVWRSLNIEDTVTEARVLCPVTMEGSFHSQTIRKVRKALIGSVIRADLNSGACTGGNATIHKETLPWLLTYEDFQGRLPNITDFDELILTPLILIRTATNTCELRMESGHPGGVNIAVGAGGRLESLKADETKRIPLTNGPGGVFCGLAEGILSGSGTVTQANGTAATIKLI